MPFVRDDDGDATPNMDTLSTSTSTVPEPREGPGRDSARLLQDIIEHKARDEALYTPPSQFDPTKPHNIQPAFHSHSWTMKSRKSVGQRPWNAHFGDQSICAVCETCRMHLFAKGLIVSEGVPKCGSQGSNFSSHHFHPESWTATHKGTKSDSIPGLGVEFVTFNCCQCPFQFETEFWTPVVPEYLLSTLKRRKTSSSPNVSSASSSSMDRSVDPKAFVAHAFSILSTYCCDVLNSYGKSQTRNINYRPDSPFVKRVGLNSDVVAFMKLLGWQQREEIQSFEPPAWDEESSAGRMTRKRLEAAEIELAVLASQNAKESETGVLAPSMIHNFLARSNLSDFNPHLVRADSDLANLMTANPWPRQSISSRIPYLQVSDFISPNATILPKGNPLGCSCKSVPSPTFQLLTTVPSQHWEL